MARRTREELLFQSDNQRFAAAGREDLAGREDFASGEFAGASGGFSGGRDDLAAGLFSGDSERAGVGMRLPKLRDVLLGSSFLYSSSHNGAGGQPAAPRHWSAWGDIAATRFDGVDGGLTLDGEVVTATVGADLSRGPWLGGVALSHSRGDGSYRQGAAEEGSVRSELTSVHPFLRYERSERTSFWGVLGYGSGESTLAPEGSGAGSGADLSRDLTTRMAAVGGRGVLSRATGGFQLAIRSDARATETTSEATAGREDSTGRTSRVRVLLEGSGSRAIASGALLGLTLEAGLRYDGGDAETGGGLEVGGGLSYACGRFALQANARMLTTHEDEAYEEWGVGGSVLYRARSDGSGLSLRLGSAWGMTQSGVQSLWALEDPRGLARGGIAMDGAQRFETELGYGIHGRAATMLWYPYFSAQSAAGGMQTLRLGLRLSSESRFETLLEFGRRMGLPGEKPENVVVLQGTVRW